MYAVVHCCLLIKLCMTLCNPLDCSPPGSSDHGISQARILVLLFPFPEDFPALGIKLAFPTLQANSILLSYQGSS